MGRSKPLATYGHCVCSLAAFLLTTVCAGAAVDSKGAGVTVIIHGWNVAAGEPTWTEAMQDAIIAELGGAAAKAKITVTGSKDNLTATCNPWDLNLDAAASGEVVVRVDWTAVANHLTTGVPAQDVAAAILPKLTQSQNGEPALARLPIHLIGHSRGGGMVHELARLLGEAGVEVEQVTALDPHPLTAADPQGLPAPLGPGNTIDTPVAVRENVLFTESYWQGIDYPEGQYVPGAYNREWTSLPGGYHEHASSSYRDFADHLNIYLLYLGTVDLSTPVDDGEAELGADERAAWFNAYEEDGAKTGFCYSRIRQANRLSTDTPVSGGDAVAAGFHDDTLLGGSGARQALSWSSATWPNVLTFDVERDGAPLGPGTVAVAPGDVLTFAYTYRDNDSAIDVSFHADADRNPFNGNGLGELASNNHATTGPDIAADTAAWTATALADSYHIYAAAGDGTQMRYIYANAVFEEAQPCNVTIATTGNGTVVPAEGSPDYVEGAEVEITAVADEGWYFVEWQGDVSGTNPVTTITCTEGMTITAVFAQGSGTALPLGAAAGIAMGLALMAAAWAQRNSKE